MFGFGAPVVTVGVVLDAVIVKMTVIVRVMRDITGDNLVEVSGAVTEIERGRGWSGCLGGGQRGLLTDGAVVHL